MSVVEDRWHAGLPFYVLAPTREMRRWVSKYSSGGDVFFGLAHGEPRPHPGPLVTIGLLSVSAKDGGVYEPHHTFANELLLAERSRNDPAFQFETRDQEVIERTVRNLDPDADWRLAPIEVDGARLDFKLRAMGGDWIATRGLDGSR